MKVLPFLKGNLFHHNIVNLLITKVHACPCQRLVICITMVTNTNTLMTWGCQWQQVTCHTKRKTCHHCRVRESTQFQLHSLGHGEDQQFVTLYKLNAENADKQQFGVTWPRWFVFRFYSLCPLRDY